MFLSEWLIAHTRVLYHSVDYSGLSVVGVTTIVYGLLGPASLVCVYVSMSVCLSVCTFVYLFSVSVIMLSTVVSCSIGGQL